MEIDLVEVISNYWEVGFLYGVKILKDISNNLNNIHTVLAVHETEINNLKFHRRTTDKKQNYL